MATANLANLRHTSFLIEEQVPAFVRSDHPQFILFLEQYYKYLQSANTGVYDSVSNTYFMGPTHFTKSALNYLDVDTTDFDRFLSSFKAEFAPSLPKQLDSITDKASFYKNILEFYKTKGTEDSFKVLFRLLYGEEIELYYPNRDILTLSGGTFSPEVRVRLDTTDNIEDIVGRRIYGANSGVYATVERIDRVYDDIKFPWRDPADRNDSVTFAYLDKFSISNTTATHTEFDIGEIIYTGNASGNHVNTMIQAAPTKTVFFDDFSTYANVNYLLAPSDNRGALTNSLSRTSGEFNISNTISTNTGLYDNRWFDWRSMNAIGDQYINPGITFVSDESAFGEIVMVVGNEGNTHGITSITSNQNTEDLVELIHTTNIKIDSNKLYKFSVRAKDPYHWANTAPRSSTSGGPRTVAGPYFNTGYSALKSDGLTFNDQQGSSYTAGEHWILSSHLPSGVMNYESANNGIGVDYGSDTQQANSWTHDWRIFQAYITGSNTIADTAGFGNSREHSNTIASPIQNVFSYIYSPAAFHTDTSYIRPLIQVEQALGDGANTGGSQFYVDYYKIEEMGTIEPLLATPHYLNESSRLSTKSAVIQDNAYYQQYAYDIRSKQNFQDYTSVVERAVHPAGFKRYGTRLSNSFISTDTPIPKSSLTAEDDTFSPDSINSLAGWWKADAIELSNIYQHQRWSSNVTSNGIFGTNTNRLPVGISAFEEGFDYTLTFKEDAIISNVVYDSTAPIGENVLKLTDKHFSGSPDVYISSNGTSLVTNTTYNDDVFSIILDQKKEWLFSAYVKTNNITVQDSQGFNTIQVGLALANTQGFNTTTNYAVTQNVSAVDTWARVSAKIDASLYWNTRAILNIGFPDRRDFGLSTGNTIVHLDGLMLEEYDSTTHGAAPYTPSPYVRPGLNGADVVSWYDHSLNEHHVYANTHGDIFHYPQYIANSINGMPAIRFRCDNANSTHFDSGVYPWSSIGGTKSSVEPTFAQGPSPGDPKHRANATAIFQATTMMANPALSRPVSNAWSIITVAKSTMDFTSLNYWPYSHLTDGNEQYAPTLFNSGYFGYSPASPGGISPQYNITPSGLAGTGGGEMRLVFKLTSFGPDPQSIIGDPNDPHSHTGYPWGYTLITNIANSAGHGSNSVQTESGRFGSLSNHATIWGYTEFAGDGLDDSLSFHGNGKRIGNNNASDTDLHYVPTTVYDGITWSAQQPYVTSIGGWAPSNNQIIDTTTGGVNQKWLYGEHNWDGDIAEVLVFNEKLTNVQMSLVEGYLAHKYSLQENLMHKDGSVSTPAPGGLDHPYRYQPPPAVGANSAPDYIDY